MTLQRLAHQELDSPHGTESWRPARAGSSSRGAFTVIELLVALGIIAILCALVLPAVQQAREGARQVQCKNNLHQIGLALQSYHERVRCFPPGWIVETPIGSDSHNGWGWLSMLLPTLDQGPLFNAINFQHHLQQDGNLTARLTMVASFVCPSDHVPARVPFFQRGIVDASRYSRHRTSPRGVHAANEPVMFEVAGASYLGVFGVKDPDDRSDVTGEGIFSLNSAARFTDFIDGASQTLVVGERSVRRLAGTWTGMHPWEQEGPERVVGFTDHAPNDPEADEAEFGSRHPSGAHFLFGDASVRFINDTIDRTVYQALGTRSGQEVVERTAY
jgi:prepilin-type processing-associated H-X9-DG protein